MRNELIDLMSALRHQLDKEMSVLSNTEEMQEIQSSELVFFGQILNERRKALGIDIHSLELQTGISSSTLKRIFKDPSQVKFISVMLVAESLGVKLWTVK